MGNLILAWRKARKGKTNKKNVKEFEKNLEANLLKLHKELSNKTYKPKPLKTFVLRDPKTRIIAKSDFDDRIVHHALINIIKPIFEKQFIYDSCANQLNKGASFALRRFHTFLCKVSDPIHISGFCLKADIFHYFQEIDHKTLLSIISKYVRDENVIWLIKQILANSNFNGGKNQKGMPLGNYTSQFLANVYLNELDYFAKHVLRAKYYIRYVDDFVILHHSGKKLEEWKEKIHNFLTKKLFITLHKDKSRIIPIKRGIDFVGFRNFYHYLLLRKRNIRKMQRKITLYKEGIFIFKKIHEIYKGLEAYAKWADTYKLRHKIKLKIINSLIENI